MRWHAGCDVSGMRAYSVDLRQRIVDAYARGEGSVRELAAQFGVDPSTVQRYRQRVRTAHTVAPRPHGGGVPRRVRGHVLRVLQGLRARQNDRTDAEYAAALAARTGVAVSRRTINRTWARQRVTYKKNAARDRTRSP
jgi:transposase